MRKKAPRRFSDKTIRAIRGSREPLSVLAARYDLHPRTISDIRSGATYAHVKGGWPEPEEPTRPSSFELLRMRVQDGWTPRQIADRYGLTIHSVHGILKRARKKYRITQNTSPADAWSGSEAAQCIPLPSTSDRMAHSAGDVTGSDAAYLPAASEGRDYGHGGASLNSPAGTPKPAGAFSHVKSGKAAGGRKSARQSNRYYGIYGGKRGQHEAARQAAQDRAEGTCAACQQPEPLDATGLCGSCATLVTRADKPGAAWGAEPGNLNRRSGGTEADNIIVGEIGL